MDVFGKGTDEPSRPLLPPGTCWVCENSPQQEAVKVIDTRRNTRAGGTMSHESVRKYICEPCALELGGAVGMATPELLAELKRERDDAQIEAMSLRERAEAAEAGQLKVVRFDSVSPAFANLADRLDSLEKSVKTDKPGITGTLKAPVAP